MNSAHIDTILRNDPCSQFTYAGVFPKDYLEKLIKARSLPAAYVVNTDPSTKPGEHWVAFYFPPFTGTGSGMKAEYFDSYGEPMRKPEFTAFAKKYGHPETKVNRIALQGSYSTVCGQYAILFILLRCRGYAFDEIVAMFTTDNQNWNDSMVAKFVNRHCGENIPVIDFKFLLQQCMSRLK